MKRILNNILGRKFMSIVLISLFLISMSLTFTSSHSQQGPPQGLPEVLEFEMLSLPWFPLSDKAAEVVAEQLSKIGIKINLVRLESAIMYPRIMQTFDYDAFALAISQSPDPTGMLLSFHSSEARPGGANYWGYINPELDALIEKAFSARSEDELKSYVMKIQEILAKGPFIPLYLSQNTQVIRGEWKNYTLMSGGILEVYNRWSLLYMYKSERLEDNVFKIAFPADILSTNPFEATDLRSIWVLNIIYDPLVALDSKFQVIPWLAEKWEIREDGKMYVFYLRKGVKFHDGKELTADDVVFTFKVGIGNNTRRFAALGKFVEDVTKIDEYTVAFRLKQPSYLFLHSLATGFVYVVPKHIWADKPIGWANPEPIGTGPFKWASRKPGESIVLDRNSQYFIAGTPKINRVIIRVIPEAETRFLAIKAGEVDTERYATSVTFLREAEKDPNLKVIVTPDIWLIYIAFNFRRFNDSRLFEAINYAINRDEIIRLAAGGYGIPVHTILNKEWHPTLYNPNIVFEYNPDKARNILESLGYKYDPARKAMRYVGAPVETPITTPTTETPIQPSIVLPLLGIILAALIVIVILRVITKKA